MKVKMLMEIDGSKFAPSNLDCPVLEVWHGRLAGYFDIGALLDF